MHSQQLDNLSNHKSPRITGVVSGALVAGPAILALVPQHLELLTKIGLGAGGVIVGIFSSFLASGRPEKKQIFAQIPSSMSCGVPISIQLVVMGGKRPVSSASAPQSLGCGRRRPARIATAYVTETPSADMMTGFAIPASSG